MDSQISPWTVEDYPEPLYIIDVPKAKKEKIEESSITTIHLRNTIKRKRIPVCDKVNDNLPPIPHRKLPINIRTKINQNLTYYKNLLHDQKCQRSILQSSSLICGCCKCILSDSENIWESPIETHNTINEPIKQK